LRLLKKGPKKLNAHDGEYYHVTEMVTDERGRLVLPKHNFKMWKRSKIRRQGNYIRDFRGPLPPMSPESLIELQAEDDSVITFENGEIFHV